MKAVACPGCSAPMECSDFARKPLGGVALDICYDCHAIWFDQLESAQLTPGAVLDLFRRIHEHHDRQARPLADVLKCPKCRAKLKLTNDVQRANRINYYRCPEGHGRLTTFLQFLREKNFVRELSKPEVAELSVRVAQVRCSGCGGPVDLKRESACGYCRAPISILDADAVKRTLAELAAAERREPMAPPMPRVDPDRALQAVLSGQRFEHRLNRGSGMRAAASMPTLVSDGPVDLLTEALDFLMGD